MIRISYKIDLKRNFTGLDTIYIGFIYSLYTGLDVWVKELAIATTVKTRSQAYQIAIDTICGMIDKDYLNDTISISDKENSGLAEKLYNIGFSSVMTHTISQEENKVLALIVKRARSESGDYESKTTRYKEDPFGIT